MNWVNKSRWVHTLIKRRFRIIIELSFFGHKGNNMLKPFPKRALTYCYPYDQFLLNFQVLACICYLWGKKEEIWLSPMTKALTPAEMSKGQGDNTNNATKKLDYTAVVDRLRTVSWSNYGHPTGVVNLVYGPNLPTPRNSRVHSLLRSDSFKWDS